MEFKAIALDMDGTTLDSNNTISNDLIDLLSTLRKKGVKVFLATGRTKIEVEDVLPKQFEVDGLVTANGMGCFAGNKQIAQYTLDPDLVSEVVAEARNNKVYYEVHPLNTKRIALLADKEYMQAELNLQKSPTLLENEYNSRLDAIENHICWVDELITTNIIKVYFFSMDSHKINQWKKRLDGKMKEKDFSTSSSSLHNVEIVVRNISKRTGIELLLKEYGLSASELLAVGDGENDIPMFKLAAHAVAMKNAEALVQKHADEVTKASYDENGLYLYLKEVFSELLNPKIRQ